MLFRLAPHPHERIEQIVNYFLLSFGHAPFYSVSNLAGFYDGSAPRNAEGVRESPPFGLAFVRCYVNDYHPISMRPSIAQRR